MRIPKLKYIERNGYTFKVDENNPFQRHDPVTMTVLMVAGTAMAAGGQVMEGQAASNEAKGQAAMADYNAKVSEQNAKQIEAKTAFDQQREAEAASRRQSSLQAGLGASGAVTTEGSPLLLQAKQASEDELSNLLVGYEGSIAAGQQRSQAALDKMQSSVYKTKASNVKTASYMKAGGTLLSGFGGMYSPKPATQTGTLSGGGSIPNFA